MLPCRKYILQSDLEGFLSKRRAAEAFHILDRDGDGQVSLAELRSSITEIFKYAAQSPAVSLASWPSS